MVFATNADPTISINFRFGYNDQGLADEWDIENYGFFHQEYVRDGRLKRSILSGNSEVFYTIKFFYNQKDNKVKKRIYYFGSGTDIMDEVFYTYNAQGYLVKVQSYINDYVALTNYTPTGNLLTSELFFSGDLVYSAFYKYDKPYKNPYRAVPGIDHAFPTYQPAELFYSKWRFASLKQVAYDENGELVVLFEYNPSKTIWNTGHQNYTLSATYFDILGKTSLPNIFAYETCGPENNNSNLGKTPPSSPGGAKM